MSALHDGDWEAAEASSPSHRSHASGLVAAHLQWHLERQLRTLPLVERVYRQPADHGEETFRQDVRHGDEPGEQLVAGGERRRKEQFPQLPPAPDDYPTFPDTSSWPVIFPELPAPAGGGPRRPPQHTSKAAPPAIPDDQLPKHVAVVMDGNGRWATQRGLSRTEGHKMGEAVLIDITCGAIEIGIKHLRVYAFSTENWRRSAEEVRFLMGFNREVVRRRRENLDIMGVQMRWVGSRARMWRSVIKEFDIAENMTIDNDVITVNYCVNYGGRAEIAEAAKQIARDAAAGRIDPERVDESDDLRAPAPPRYPGRRSVHPHLGGTAGQQLHAVAGGLRRVRVPGQALARLRPPRPVGGMRGVRQPQPPIRSRVAVELSARLADALAEVLPVDVETDGALTVRHDGTFASLRTVTIADDIQMVSVTQVLAWDLPLNADLRKRVAAHAQTTMLGTVTLIEQPAKRGDVMLRYNFPGVGLSDAALRTLVLMVLAGGADVRRALQV